MAVNPDSRIPLWVKTFAPYFYTSITDKENWTFNNYSGGALSAAKSYFQDLGNRLDEYKATNRYNNYTSLIGSVYQYFLCTRNFYATPLPEEDVLHIGNIFSFGNFIKETLDRPIGYYNDIEETLPDSGNYESQKLKDSIDYVRTSAIGDENANITTLINRLNPISMEVINKGMFEELTPAQNPMGKRDVGLYIFETLNYKKIVYQLNVSPFELPSYITP